MYAGDAWRRVRLVAAKRASGDVVESLRGIAEDGEVREDELLFFEDRFVSPEPPGVYYSWYGSDGRHWRGATRGGPCWASTARPTPQSSAGT